jgi:hypothetical protein
MKKIMPFIVFLCCFGTVLHAQLDTFDLSRYKLPEIKFRQLDLNFNLSGSNSLNSIKDENSSYKNSTVSSSNNLDIGYSSYRNSERLQNEQDFRIGFFPGFQNSKTDGDLTYKRSAINSYIVLKSINRIYYQNQFFFEPDIKIMGSFDWLKEHNKSDLKLSKSDEASSDIEIPLMIGHGRIEQIQDARLAIYILEELQKSGRISRLPGNEEIMEFSRLISRLKNERYFDYRLRKMEEIEKVDSFLQDKGIITSPDARYFTIVNDNWDYAQGPIRESGKRLSAGLIPAYSYLYTNQETSYSDPVDTIGRKYNKNTIGIRMQGLYEIERPVNLHWQRSLSLKLSYGYSRNFISSQFIEQSEDKSNIDQLMLETGIKYAMGFYPNSRTNITGQVSLDYQHLNKLENQDQPNAKSNGDIITPDISLVMHYYISPQFRLNVNYHINYNYTKNNYKNAEDYIYFKNNILYQNFDVGFIYSFF